MTMLAEHTPPEPPAKGPGPLKAFFQRLQMAHGRKLVIAVPSAVADAAVPAAVPDRVQDQPGGTGVGGPALH